MARDWLQGIDNAYDVIVVGSGIAGLTAARRLAADGFRVLVLEHHYQFGGLATWFRRKGGHVFDISLHGFPVGMVKSVRRYWSAAIAERIHPLRDIRFRNPQYDLRTTFDREDFTRHLRETFGQPETVVEGFFRHLREMDHTRDDGTTIGDLFERFFPGRPDVHRFLLEPIAFANGSALEDPALVYGIVFSNFVSKGVHIFHGGTDRLIEALVDELRGAGVEVRKLALVERIETEPGPDGRPVAVGVHVNGRFVRARAVVSNAHLKTTTLGLLAEGVLPPDFAARVRAVRPNSSSCQVYFGLRPGAEIPRVGDIVFTSKSAGFSTAELLSRRTTSRTFSFYYPEMRPDRTPPRTTVVASLNADPAQWERLDAASYEAEKDRLVREAEAGLEELVPGIGGLIEHREAATPRTVGRYIRSPGGASFGTKFEGLAVSRELPDVVPGLYHASSVGIIMSGWLGTMNYGVIVADRVARDLRAAAGAARSS